MKDFIDPNKDGIDHINIYSKGKTKLGQLLSNFAHTPFRCTDGEFASVEGYWHWLLADERHEDRERLRELYGFRAKELGRDIIDVSKEVPEFKSKILMAFAFKLIDNPYIAEMVLENNLPYLHYYVYGDKVVDVTEKYKWMIDYWNDLSCIDKQV